LNPKHLQVIQSIKNTRIVA